jgi:hypothetical protein
MTAGNKRYRKKNTFTVSRFTAVWDLSVNQPAVMSVDVLELRIICLVDWWLRSKQIVFMFQVFQHRQQCIKDDTFKVIGDLVHLYFIDVLIFDFFHDKVLYSADKSLRST